MARHQDRNLLLTSWFWGIIESSERSLVALCRQLEELPKEKLRRYQVLYDMAKSRVNPQYWEACHPYLPEDGCSEDRSDDFAAWVVSWGRTFFKEVRARPSQIQRYLEMFSDYEIGGGPLKLRWKVSV